MVYGGTRERYFSSCLYNAARMVNALAEMVKEEGGTVDDGNEELHIHTRGYDENLMRAEKNLSSAELMVRGEEKGCSQQLHERRMAYIRRMESDIERLKSMKESAPVISTRFVSLVSDLWIRFELGGFRYTMEFDTNPFFPDNVLKVPAEGDGKYYMDDIQAEDKFYYTNSFYEPVASEDSVVESAKKLLEFLKGMKQSKRCYIIH